MGRDRVYEKIRERISIFDRDLFLEFILIILIFFGGYRYIFLSYEKSLLIEKSISREIKEIKLYEEKIIKLKKALSKSEEKNEPKEEIYFSELSEFKNVIKEILDKGNLKILSIASAEKEDERIYYSYHISGDEKELIKFIKNIENEKNAFTLLNAPMRMEKNSLEIKIGGYFRIIEKKDRAGQENSRDKIFSSGEIAIEFYPISEKCGTVILKGKDKNLKRVIVNEEKKIDYYGEIYEFKIKNRRLTVE